MPTITPQMAKELTHAGSLCVEWHTNHNKSWCFVVLICKAN